MPNIEQTTPPEVIFVSDIRKHYPERYDNLVGVWRRLAKRFYRKDADSGISDNRLINARDFGIQCQDINSRHGVDFLNDIIPAVIERVKKENPKRKVRILDSGCGLAFAADQIRNKFGNDVKVFGTSLAKGPRITQRKRRIIHELREHSKFARFGIAEDLIDITADVRDQILSSIGRDLEPKKNEKKMVHAHDAKWRSMLELSDYPEFDLIIDTFGELYYSDDVSLAPDDFLDNFNKVFRAAIKKLLPNGRLYIAALQREGQAGFVEHEKQKMEQQYGVTMKRKETRIDGQTLGGLVVTKS